MSNFEWETEENWDTGIVQEAPKGRATRVRWGRIVAWSLLVLTLSGSVGSVLWWRVQRVDAQLTEEVISSFELVRQSIETEDRELFTGLLSGREDEWLLTQITLYKEFQLTDRTMFGLDLAVSNQPQIVPDVVLDPNLTSADVSFRQRYVTKKGETVDLQLTEVYRQGLTRWLYSPPLSEDFWQEWERYDESFGRIEVTFPGRDRAYVWHVRDYLDEKIDELCQLPDMRCPADYSVEVVFHTDPFTMLQWQSMEHRLTREPQIIVPTPTLIGVPLDEAGQEALNEVYAELVLTRVIVDIVEYECCASQVVLMNGFIERQLVALDIVPQSLEFESTDIN